MISKAKHLYVEQFQQNVRQQDNHDPGSELQPSSDQSRLPQHAGVTTHTQRKSALSPANKPLPIARKTVRFQLDNETLNNDKNEMTPFQQRRREKKEMRKLQLQLIRMQNHRGQASLIPVTQAYRSAHPNPAIPQRYPFTAQLAMEKTYSVSLEEMAKNLSAMKASQDKELDVARFEEIEKRWAEIKDDNPASPRASDRVNAENEEYAQLSTASRLAEDEEGREAGQGEVGYQAANDKKRNVKRVNSKDCRFPGFLNRINARELDPLHRAALELLCENYGQEVSYYKFYVHFQDLNLFGNEEVLAGRRTAQDIVMSMKAYFKARDWPWVFIETQEGVIFPRFDKDGKSLHPAMRVEMLQTRNEIHRDGIQFTPHDLRRSVANVKDEKLWAAVKQMLAGSHLSMIDLIDMTDLPSTTIEDCLARINHAARQKFGIDTLIFRGYYGYQTCHLNASYGNADGRALRPRNNSKR